MLVLITVEINLFSKKMHLSKDYTDLDCTEAAVTIYTYLCVHNKYRNYCHYAHCTSGKCFHNVKTLLKCHKQYGCMTLHFQYVGTLAC